VDQLFITGSQGSQATQYVTVGAGIAMGIANAIMEGSLVGVAGELPERYMQAFVAGTAGSGMPFNLSPCVFFLEGCRNPRSRGNSRHICGETSSH
jgi:hypothetical protein